MHQRISVAMGTFDGERFIGEQLASLARQSRLPDELVVCDDNSADGTVRAVERFAANSPFEVRLFRNPTRLGFSENFLGAAAKCSGDLIAFCDQDDVWDPMKLERCERAFADTRDAVLVTHALRPFSDGRPVARRGRWSWRQPKVAAPLAADPTFDAYGHTLMFRRSLLDLARQDRRPSSRAHKGPMVHDEWIYFLALVTGSVVFLPDKLVQYRVHEGNAVGPPPALAHRTQTVPRLTHVEVCRGYALLCEEYADYLQDLSNPRAERVQDRLERGAEFYRRRASLWRLRGRAVERRGLGAVLGLARFAMRGGYRSRHDGGVGLLGAGRDVMTILQGRGKGIAAETP